MVVLDLDHPEITDFIRWKVREEKKVAALVAGGYSSDFNGDAYGTVSGQNSNNSVRLPDGFMEAVVNDGQWQTTMRTTGEVYETLRARAVARDLRGGMAVRGSRRQYDDTIQVAHLQGDRPHQRHEPVQRVRCSSTTPRAIWRRST